ncbi:MULTISPECIES: globin domain-containing protein [Streptomycetaceae]|uniref:nitric oxide dioxygenase n=1 Tax=Streptantibioticus cattleyicolor (strain ATCC 35852 / DSM 46488 / JCM 4925 / NBRC 14057 / NRRL 8057) TaxID=1003195 RepID=F8K470_STREN|nr:MULTISPECIES: globin domain-containing protein [Streptomycetaceae]AEW92617.1 Oxidoreductase FAD-binding domain protein [Streptantibioticus cattleyicolor NRRL 8057 = DSM 46488]MYS57397.1 hemin transporter [Streptomyces sp. SID5468]CCB72971.1 Flavohemoprotein [Streptantibioticus cattleyicolor NRRL 8057 = DSM 46488]
MLSESSAATVRATLPAVGAAIGEITTVFYDRLFEAHPELLRDLFNRGNQANGSQKQALAGSIAAFAGALLERPDERPDAMLGRIAHKHASLGITRDQYKVVHTHLFAAIAQVLGEAVTPEVAAAWDEVYWLMANALAAIEERLYAEAGAADGDTWREYRVESRHRETDDVLTFVVRPTDGAAVPSFRPGQYVSVRVELADGARQIRQYSLSGAPEGALRFTVKNVGGTPAGEVSRHLHERVREGDVIPVSAPFGDVFLEDGDAPLLLASAGIGCTPMIGMLTHLAATGSRRPVTVVHADRAPRTHALRAELDSLVARLPQTDAHVWYEEPQGPWPAERTGLLDLSTVEIPAGTTAYLCGPLPFLRAARAQLLAAGVAAADIHYEVFGPDLWLAQG